MRFLAYICGYQQSNKEELPGDKSIQLSIKEHNITSMLIIILSQCVVGNRGLANTKCDVRMIVHDQRSNKGIW